MPHLIRYKMQCGHIRRGFGDDFASYMESCTHLLSAFAHLNPHGSDFGDMFLCIIFPFSGTSSPCNLLFLNPGIYGLVQATVGVGTVLIWGFCVAIARAGGLFVSVVMAVLVCVCVCVVFVFMFVGRGGAAYSMAYRLLRVAGGSAPSCPSMKPNHVCLSCGGSSPEWGLVRCGCVATAALVSRMRFRFSLRDAVRCDDARGAFF